METAASEVDKHDGETETETKTGSEGHKNGSKGHKNGSKGHKNGTKVKFEKGNSPNKKGAHKERSHHQREEGAGVKVSRRKGEGGPVTSADVPQRKERQSRRAKQRNTLIDKVSQDRKFLIDKRRDREFRREFKESDDDDPDWDPRLREVKAKFAEVTLAKKKEAKKVWKAIEAAKSESDSADEKESTDGNKSDSDNPDNTKKRNSRSQKGDRAKKRQSGDASDGDAWFWDAEVRTTLEGLKGTRSEGWKSGRKGLDDDDDPWFWKPKGFTPRPSTATRDKTGDTKTSDGGGISEPIGRKQRLGTQLKSSIEKIQLKEFRKEYYARLNDAQRISDSSSRNSSSSSTSTPSSLSSDIEDSIGNPKAKRELKRYLDNSSDDDEVIVYTKRGWTIRRAPASTSKLVPGRKKSFRFNWSDQSSDSSTSTASSSDTEKSSSSQTEAATD